MLNIETLIKKWNNFANWFFLAPIYFCLFLIFFFITLAVSAFLGDVLIGLTSLIIFLPFLFFFLIIFCFYNLIYLIKSDGVFKYLNVDRGLWNIINILLTLTGLNFIMLILMYIKVKDVYEYHNIKSNIFLKVKY